MSYTAALFDSLLKASASPSVPLARTGGWPASPAPRAAAESLRSARDYDDDEHATYVGGGGGSGSGAAARGELPSELDECCEQSAR